MPDRYAYITSGTIYAQLRALDVPSVDIKRGGVNLKDAKATTTDKAINRRKMNGV